MGAREAGNIEGNSEFFGLRKFAHFLNSNIPHPLLSKVIDSFIASSITYKILQISRFYRVLGSYFQMSTGHFHFEFPHVQNGLSPFPANLIFLWNIFPSTFIQSGNLGVCPFFLSLPAFSSSFVEPMSSSCWEPGIVVAQ